MRKLLLYSIFLALALVSSVSHAERNDDITPIALVGVNVIDGTGTSTALRNQVILIEGDTILSVEAADTANVPSHTRTVDLRGKWVTPGLIDAHIHLFQSGGLYTRPDIFDLRDVRPYTTEASSVTSSLDDTLKRYLASGVTSTADLGGPMWTLDVKSRASAGTPSPRLSMAGPIIATARTPRQKRLDLGDPPIISAHSVRHAESITRNLLKQNPDFISVWGISGDQGNIDRIRDITKAVSTISHPAGIRVAVHAEGLADARAAVEGGADILVHGISDELVNDEFVTLLKQNDVIYITAIMTHEGYSDAAVGRVDLSAIERTLADPQQIVSLAEVPEQDKIAARLTASDSSRQYIARRNAKKLVESGVVVAVGSGAGNIGTLHGPAIHREMEILAATGLDPLDIITLATNNASYVFDPQPKVGRIAPGFRADLLVLNADPTEDIRNLSKIDSIWSRGVSYTQHELIPPSPEAIVQTQLDHYNARDIDQFIETYAEDVELFDFPNAGTITISGKHALRAFFEEFFMEHPDGFCEVSKRIVLGNYVVDRELCRFTPGDHDETHRAIAVYQVVDGKIQRVWFADE